jgi:cation:H+ antiporter
MIHLILLFSGLVLLVAGAHFAVQGASRIASRLGVPQLVIGMTLVAFGTGMPELVLNVMSAWSGSTSLAFGNLIGASTINVSLVLGITAIITPLVVKKSVVTREIPLMILSGLALLALSSDTILGHFPVNLLDRADGIVLLLFFSIFLYYTIFDLATQSKGDSFVELVSSEIETSTVDESKTSTTFLLFYVLIGLLAVTFGAKLALEGAVGFASMLGISESIIGLTIVSFGTTLPELVTCLVASRKGHHDLVLGNLVGSNLLNLMLFFGIVAVVHPIPLPEYGLYDLLLFSLLSLALAPIAMRGPMKITRGEGIFLVGFYLLGTSVRVFLLGS